MRRDDALRGPAQAGSYLLKRVCWFGPSGSRSGADAPQRQALTEQVLRHGDTVALERTGPRPSRAEVQSLLLLLLQTRLCQIDVALDPAKHLIIDHLLVAQLQDHFAFHLQQLVG